MGPFTKLVVFAITHHGVQAFKPWLEPFLGPLFRALASDSQLCRAAAGSCVGFLRELLGPRILAARLDDAQRAALASSPDIPPPSGTHLGPCNNFTRP